MPGIGNHSSIEAVFSGAVERSLRSEAPHPVTSAAGGYCPNFVSARGQLEGVPFPTSSREQAKLICATDSSFNTKRTRPFQSATRIQFDFSMPAITARDLFSGHSARFGRAG